MVPMKNTLEGLVGGCAGAERCNVRGSTDRGVSETRDSVSGGIVDSWAASWSPSYGSVMIVEGVKGVKAVKGHWFLSKILLGVFTT